MIFLDFCSNILSSSDAGVLLTTRRVGNILYHKKDKNFYIKKKSCL